MKFSIHTKNIDLNPGDLIETSGERGIKKYYLVNIIFNIDTGYELLFEDEDSYLARRVVQ